MGFRQPALREKAIADKFSGREADVAGYVFHVLPGTSATHLDFARKLHRNVYTDVNAAYADVVSGRGDAIVVWPGAHTLTAALAASKDNVTFIGMEAWQGLRVRKSAASITAFAANKGITVTGVNNRFVGLTFIPVTTKSFMDFSAAALRLFVQNCFFDLFTPVVNTGTKGMVATGAASDVTVSSCTFHADGAQGPAIDATALVESTIEENLFHFTAGTWANCILVGAATQGLLINKNRFTGYGTAVTAAIDGTGATIQAGVAIYENRFGVGYTTKPIDNFSATNLTDMALNYVATIGAGSGGTLITANT